jgi:outer membrane protein
VTRTDVAQAEAQLAGGQSAVAAAEATLIASKARYRRVIGTEPGILAPATPVDRFSPSTLAAAIGAGLTENPNVTAAMYGIDVAHLQVKIAEGALYPQLTLTGTVQKQWEPSLTVTELFAASAILSLNMPLYQGGSEYSLIRQQKEVVAQQRLNLEQVRDQVRATIVQSWGQVEAAKAQILSTQQQVAAAEIALNGVREEARVGQRTTLDVLITQQTLVNARVSLVAAQRDRVVASYNLLAAVGRLSPQVLGIRVPIYDPMVHYQQVRDSWFGVRTPDGR